MPARLRRRVAGAGRDDGAGQLGGLRPSASVDPGVLTAIALACRDTERIRFSYTAADGAAGRPARRTAPAGAARPPLVPGRRTTWTGNGWRSFRLDRLGRAARHRGPVPAARAARRRRRRLRPGRRSRTPGPDTTSRSSSRRRPRRCGSGSAGGLRSRRSAPTRCRVRMTADALDWPIMALGMVGADFQVISPPELVDRVRDWGARFSRAAGPRSGRAPVAAAAARARPRPGSLWPRPRE